jgi:hypothetical protein
MEKSNRFGISSIFSYSNQSNSLGKIADGWYATTSVGKMNGAWVYNLSTEIISNEYNPNDLGYLVEFNEISTSANLGFRKFSQFWIFNETTNNISFSYETLYENAAFASTEIAMSNYATTTNHISIWHDINWQPTNVNDYYEPRIAGRFYDRPASFNDNIFISTDYRKRLAVDFRAMYYADNEERHGFWANISPLTRFGKKISLRYIYSCDYDLDGAGYVDLIGADTIVFGRRNVLTFTNSLNVNYVLTNKLSISLKARHYVSSVDYHSFYYLNMDGSLSPNNDYTEDRDYNFNSFNVDFLFSWNFSPGSYLSIMWKNQIFKSDYIPETELIPSYYDSFKDIWREPQFNSLSLKLIYYLDYNSVLKRY